MATFGYTTQGSAGTSTLENVVTGSEFTTPAGGPFTVQKITAYTTPSANQFTTKCAIYTAAGALVSGSTTDVVTGTSGAGWRDFTYASGGPALSGGTAYILVAWSNSRSGTNVISRDAGATNQGHTSSATYGASFPASPTFTHSTNQYSIYATITVEHAIAGATPLTITVAGAAAYNRHPAIAGDVTVALSPASPAQYNWAKALAGDVVVGLSPAAAMEYAAGAVGHEIAGDVALGLAPSAAAQYNRNASIAGALNLTVEVVGALAFNRHASVAGDVVLDLGVGASLAYNRNASLVGAVPLGLTPGATLKYNRNATLTGDVAIGMGVAATMVYGHWVGQPEIVGAVGLALGVGATLQYNRHPSITGNVPLGLDVASAITRTHNHVRIGAVTFTLTPHATTSRTRVLVLDGAIAVWLVPMSDCEFYSQAVSPTYSVHGSVAPLGGVTTSTQHNGVSAGSATFGRISTTHRVVGD